MENIMCTQHTHTPNSQLNEIQYANMIFFVLDKVLMKNHST